MTDGSLTLAVRAAEIPADGRRFRLAATESERERLREELGIPAVEDLTAEFDVRPLPDGAFAVTGSLAARVVQTDIVTLEPVPQAVRESIALTLVPAENTAAGSGPLGELNEAEAPDTFPGGRIDLGALAREHLALGLDPYPRAPGVEFDGHVEGDPSSEGSPFAALAALKNNEE